MLPYAPQRLVVPRHGQLHLFHGVGEPEDVRIFRISSRRLGHQSVQDGLDPREFDRKPFHVDSLALPEGGRISLFDFRGACFFDLKIGFSILSTEKSRDLIANSRS
eukprot:675374-Hanusia_phi.AAC.1